MEPVFTALQISKHFGGVHALWDIDMELYRGEILGLVGDNGAGKSTLLKILTGAYKPNRGQIFFEGKEIVIRDPQHSRELGIEMIYQHLALCKKLDIASNLFLGRELSWSLFGLVHFLKKKDMAKMAVETLQDLKIDIKNPRKTVNNLSGGQQQAVAIGKAVRFNPKVVLMDEPTANLAVRESEKVLDLMLKMKNDGIAIVFVTHRLQDIFEVSDRIYILKGGKKVDCRRRDDIDQEEIVRLMFLEKTSN